MAIMNLSKIVLILIISHSMGLELFGGSKTDTQETSLNVASVSSLLNFVCQSCIFWDNYETQKDMR